jgi:hypothetical protein
VLRVCSALSSAVWFGSRRKNENGWFFSPLVPQHSSASRYTIRQLSFFSVVWRAMLVGLGVLYATGNFLGDLHYTRGASDLTFVELERAAEIFPYNHEYRIGPAKLVIKDAKWWEPRAAIPVLLQALRYDPNSHYLKRWIEIFARRIA